jgi:hypothetical protein
VEECNFLSIAAAAAAFPILRIVIYCCSIKFLIIAAALATFHPAGIRSRALPA